VSIGDSLRRWRDLARLRARVRRTPSPSAYGELAERLIAVGSVGDALATAEEGLQRFPDSERLANVRLFAKRGRVTGRIRRLRDDVQRRPTPVVYSQLVDVYREIGSIDEALQTAQECAERFPLNESPHLLQGEIRLDRFVSDLIARDAILAEQALRRVVRINSRNLRAHTLLAELSWLVGDEGGCRRHLRSVLALSPADTGVQDLLRDLGGDDAAEPGVAAAFEDLARAVEESGALARPAERFPGSTRASKGEGRSRSAHLDIDGLKAHVVDLGSQPGVQASIVLDRDGSILADTGSGGAGSRRQFADLVLALCATADDASRRMDTGALVRAEIESPSGSVTVTRVRNVTVGVRFDGTLRAERVWDVLQDFVARNLVADDGEGARA
jgi:predicted regulator of Ras-like GTPase activity (Roadblock/LC7/MglB family)